MSTNSNEDRIARYEEVIRKGFDDYVSDGVINAIVGFLKYNNSLIEGGGMIIALPDGTITQVQGNALAASSMTEQADRILSTKSIQVPSGSIFLGPDIRLSAANRAINIVNLTTGRRALILADLYTDAGSQPAFVREFPAIETVDINLLEDTVSTGDVSFPLTTTDNRFIQSFTVRSSAPLPNCRFMIRLGGPTGAIIYDSITHNILGTGEDETFQLANPLILDNNTTVTIQGEDVIGLLGTTISGVFVPYLRFGLHTFTEELLATQAWVTANFTGGTVDLSTHSVTELMDVTSAGSGIIITDQERTRLNQLQLGRFLGVFATEAALIAAQPVGIMGDHALVTATSTIWYWDAAAGTPAWVDSTVGGGTGGDMLAAVYDPTSIMSDAFARANHTGTQAQDTITGLVAALAARYSTPGQVVTALQTLTGTDRLNISAVDDTALDLVAASEPTPGTLQFTRRNGSVITIVVGSMFNTPQLLSFDIEGQSTNVVPPFTLTGNQIFNFNLTFQANVQGNLSLTQTGTEIATPVPGASPFTTAVTGVTLNAGESVVFNLSGTDTQGGTFSRDFIIRANALQEQLYYGVELTNDAATFDTTAAESSANFTGNFTIPTFTGSQFLKIAYPATEPAITQLVIGGVDQLGAFTLTSDAQVVGGEEYDVLVSNNALIGSVVSGVVFTITR